MEAFYRFLASNEVLIYLLLALGGLFAFRWLWKTWREWRNAVFGLEREFALRRMSQALAVSILIVMLFFAELILASFVIPVLPSATFMATPTLDTLNLSSSTLTGAPDALMTAAPSVLSSEFSSGGCVPDQVILTSPEPGAQVSGIVDLVGTANIPDFGFYKYEVSPQDAENWATISADREIKVNEDLGPWDTSALTPGDYQLRLVVTDSQGQVYPPCVIPVRVVAAQ